MVTVLALSLGAQNAPVQARSAWDGPWSPTIAEHEVQRFVDLWAPRILDEDWLGPFLKAEEIPPDILAEGFHHLDGHTQTYLTARLFDRLAAVNAELGDEVRRLRVSNRIRALDEQRVLLHLMVFDRSWVKRFRHPESPAPKAPPKAAPSELEKRVVAARAVRLSPPEPAGIEPRMRAREARRVPTAVPKPLAWPSVPPIAMAGVGPNLPLGPLTYRVCAQLRGCSTDVPLGTPWPMDITGDPAPDVIATLSPDLLALRPETIGTRSQAVLAFEFSVSQIGNFRTIQEHVYVIVDVPQIRRRISVGFNGLSSTLAARSGVSIGLGDPVGALAGGANVQLRVTHTKPAPSGITFGVTTITPTSPTDPPAESDPINGEFVFAPVPSSLTLSVVANRIPLAESYQATIGVSEATKVTFGATARFGTLVRQLATVIDQLPQSVTVTFSPKTGGGIEVHYRASSLITLITAGAELRDDASPGNRDVLTGAIHRLPSEIRVTVLPAGPQVVQYRAQGIVPKVEASFARYQGGSSPALVLNATVLDVPSTIDLTLDAAGRAVTWTASTDVTEVTLGAQVPAAGRIWQAGLTIRGIPAQWDLTFLQGAPVVWRGISGSIGSVEGTLTNLGYVYVPPAPNYVAVGLNANNGDFHAAFKMLAVKVVRFGSGGQGFTGELQMGGGQRFEVWGRYYADPTRARIDVVLDPLPTLITFSQQSEVIILNTDTNFSLSMYAEVGNLGAILNTPAPPYVHGVSIRDGSGCSLGVCGNAVKASLYLTGLPTTVEIRPRDPNTLVVIRNFKPTTTQMRVDVELDQITTPYTRLELDQVGIPSPLTELIIGPSYTTTLADGSKQTKVGYKASAPLGSLYVTLMRGTDLGTLYVSNIPSRLTVTVTAANGNTSVATDIGEEISQIQATFRRTSDVVAGALVQISQIPRNTMTLAFGRRTVSDSTGEYTVPGLSYRAGASTLDVFAFAEASFFGGDVTARARAQITNLGATTDAILQGRSLVVTSTPATSLIELHTWGRIRFVKEWDECLVGCGFFRLRTYGKGGVDPATINDLMVKTTNVSNLTLTPGLTSALTGSFGSFEFGWDSINISAILNAYLQVCAGAGVCFDIIPPINYSSTFTFNLLFQIGANHYAPWRHVDTLVVVCYARVGGFGIQHIHIGLKPHPHFASWNRVALGSPAGEGGWLVTANPFYGRGLPIGDGIIGWAGELAAGFASPLGGGPTVGFPCSSEKGDPGQGIKSHDDDWGY